jgi:hypothetical protein
MKKKKPLTTTSISIGRSKWRAKPWEEKLSLKRHPLKSVALFAEDLFDDIEDAGGMEAIIGAKDVSRPGTRSSSAIECPIGLRLSIISRLLSAGATMADVVDYAAWFYLRRYGPAIGRSTFAMRMGMLSGKAEMHCMLDKKSCLPKGMARSIDRATFRCLGGLYKA